MSRDQYRTLAYPCCGFVESRTIGAHCGLIEEGDVRNDPSVERLAETAVSHARAGADVVAPSDMMDGRVGAIRQALDRHGFEETAILRYDAKDVAPRFPA